MGYIIIHDEFSNVSKLKLTWTSYQIIIFCEFAFISKNKSYAFNHFVFSLSLHSDLYIKVK